MLSFFSIVEQHHLPVTQITVDDQVLNNIFALKAKEVDGVDWIFKAVDKNGPRLIFPGNLVLMKLRPETPAEVVFTLNVPKALSMSIIFDSGKTADAFYGCITKVPNRILDYQWTV